MLFTLAGVWQVDLHGVFYAVMQGVLYILCYQNKRLLEMQGAPKREQLGAALELLLSGGLNPLKFIQDSIVVEFERLTLCDCVERIRSANDSTAVGSHSLGGADNKLDDFFPFDPILLKGTASLINPLYNFWQEAPILREKDDTPGETSSKPAHRQAVLGF